MNPQFKDAELHARHALQVLPDGGMLAVLMRIELDHREGRTDLLERCHTAIITGRPFRRRHRMIRSGQPNL